jgi:glycosyltransferase involved in cell wall biosynthesis
MIKIMHLITSIHLGGSEVVAFNLAEQCKKQHPNEFEFVVTELHSSSDSYAQDKKKELAAKNIKTICLWKGSKRVSLIIAPFTLIYHIIKEKPQIIHSHTDLPDFVLATTIRILYFFRMKTPTIMRTIHNTELWSTHDRMGKYTESIFINDTVVGVSEASLTAYHALRVKNKLPVSPNQHLIYNGCRIPQKREIPFKIDSKKINIAFCGRFELQKGIDILIERIQEINAKFGDDLLFHIIGSGTYENEVLKLSKNTPNVLMYEAVANIADKLWGFDFLIMPSRFEGLVLLSIEASYSKVPVIAAFAPGLDETLPSDWPLHFHLESHDELLLLVEKLVSKKYDLDTLKEEAFRFVSDKFSLDRMANMYAKLYLKL